MPKPDVSKERKQQILNAALQVFSSKPYEKVSMREIVKKSCMSVGGVYWYFKSKEEILAALLYKNAEENIELLEQLLKMDAPAVLRLKLMFGQIEEQIETTSPLYLMGAKYHAMLGSEPESRILMEKLGEGYRSGLSELIKQGITRGEFPRVDADLVAAGLIGAYEGVMLIWVMSPQKIKLRETLKTISELLLTGLNSSSQKSDTVKSKR
jgi:AcrR family transcriptional regulator